MKKLPYTELFLPPFHYSIYVFTDKEAYLEFGIKHSLFKNPMKARKNSAGNIGETLDTRNNPKVGDFICMLLPCVNDCSDFDLEETIDHEVIHVVFRILKMVGSGVGSDYENHEHFAYSVNYLDREIKTKVYKLKPKTEKSKR